ncbi:hypothetical protein AB0K09_09710 [Streptomyces sp. NPDC049577]|uniref:hypothetical protein n=1 Tax=Streptomyces sp. NPDC049577 TaxID=3155153 RepID=UPI00343B3867
MRILLAGAAATALLLTAATGAHADPDADSDSALTHEGTVQRGRETVFTVTTSQEALDAAGRLVVESPAFAKKLTLKAERFREGKDGVLYTKVAGMVLCDVEPGTYPVTLKDGDDSDPADELDLTVVPDMDPGNRAFCEGPASYEDAIDRTSETAPDEEDEDSGSGLSLTGLAAVIAGTAALSAALAATATYLVTRRRRG